MRILPIFLCCSLVGCTNLLPKEKDASQSNWDSFDAAQAAYDRITPGVTDAKALAELALDPYKDANIAILNYTDVLRRLAGNTGGTTDFLDPAVRDCIAARELCRGFEIDIKHMDRRREGNFWLDFLNFRRTTNIAGWRFNAVFVLKGDLVVYKLWSGQPTIKEVEDVRHPLGPLQGIGESIRPSIQ